jgi:hypothetical protein
VTTFTAKALQVTTYTAIALQVTTYTAIALQVTTYTAIALQVTTYTAIADIQASHIRKKYWKGRETLRSKGCPGKQLLLVWAARKQKE